MTEDHNAPLRMKLTIEGCPYEDREDFKTYMNAVEIKGVLWEVDQKIRARLKYSEDVAPEEDKFLEELRSFIWDENILE